MQDTFFNFPSSYSTGVRTEERPPIRAGAVAHGRRSISLPPQTGQPAWFATCKCIKTRWQVYGEMTSPKRVCRPQRLIRYLRTALAERSSSFSIRDLVFCVQLGSRQGSARYLSLRDCDDEHVGGGAFNPGSVDAFYDVIVGQAGLGCAV